MKHSQTTTIHLRGKDASNFMKAIAAERTQANEGSEENRHVPLLIAMEAAQKDLLVRLEKAEAERDALVEALVDAESALSLMHHRKSDDLVCRALTSVCAALARVKGEV